MCIYCLKPYPKERRFTEIKMGRNRLSGYFIHNLSLTVAVVNSESEEANLQEKCACFFSKSVTSSFSTRMMIGPFLSSDLNTQRWLATGASGLHYYSVGV